MLRLFEKPIFIFWLQQTCLPPHFSTGAQQTPLLAFLLDASLNQLNYCIFSKTMKYEHHDQLDVLNNVNMDRIC